MTSWVPRLAPSSMNCTPATVTLSVAFADTTTAAPETVAPTAGAVIVTAGGAASEATVLSTWTIVATDGTPFVSTRNSM